MSSSVPVFLKFLFSRVQRAFGDFLGWMNSYNTVISEFFDQALFPVVLVEYLVYEYPISHQQAGMIKAAMVTLVAIMNILGINVVFAVSVVFTVIITTPLFIELGFQFN